MISIVKSHANGLAVFASSFTMYATVPAHFYTESRKSADCIRVRTLHMYRLISLHAFPCMYRLISLSTHSDANTPVHFDWRSTFTSRALACRFVRNNKR